MTRTRSSNSRLFVITALLLGGFLSPAAKAFAEPGAEPDVSTANSQAAPRNVNHNVKEEIRLANDYLTGHGVAQDFGESAYWFEKAAETGDAQAQEQIGYFYEAGIGVRRDLERAAHWYELAASSGSVTANVSLGTLYFWGTGVRKDRELALQLFSRAAAKGSGLAACYLGDMYYLGAGVPQDKAAGEKWYEKGAELHNAQAEFDLGLLFFDREGHAHDPRRAAALLRESAAAGYVPAMYSLGALLVRNPNLANSADEAMVLLNDSAKAGHWQSSLLLGVLAREGMGVPLDSSAAYYHFRVAALQGGDAAVKMLGADMRRLSTILAPDERASLDQKAENWFGQHRNMLEFVSKEGGGSCKVFRICTGRP